MKHKSEEITGVKSFIASKIAKVFIPWETAWLVIRELAQDAIASFVTCGL